jgi:hypothetical protein
VTMLARFWITLAISVSVRAGRPVGISVKYTHTVLRTGLSGGPTGARSPTWANPKEGRVEDGRTEKAQKDEASVPRFSCQPHNALFSCAGTLTQAHVRDGRVLFNAFRILALDLGLDARKDLLELAVRPRYGEFPSSPRHINKETDSCTSYSGQRLTELAICSRKALQ